jgi:hypothetical protein
VTTTIASSQKSPRTARSKRSKRPCLLASEIADRLEQQRVVTERIGRGVCAECGRKTSGVFCSESLAQFPKVEDIGYPVSGWQYRIVLKVPEYMGEITVERVDAFPPERRNRREIIAFCQTREEAQKLIQKRIARHQ